MNEDNHPIFLNQNVHLTDRKNYNRLREAIRRQDKALVLDLMKNGAQVHCIHGLYHAHRTPFHLAVVSRCDEIVRILLDCGADPGLAENYRDSPLLLAAKIEYTTAIDLFLSCNIGNHENYLRFSHLHVACMRNRVDVVRRLLMMNQGKHINSAVLGNSMCWAGYTPLHFAVHHGCMEVARLLLECGANITAKDSRESTPLHLAHMLENERMVDLILEVHKHEFTNPQDANGLSHFHIACTRDDVSVVKHFLSLGVNLNSEDEFKGWRALDYAVYHECPSVVHLLLKNNASFKSFRAFDLLKYAFITENNSIYNLFRERQIDFSNDCEDFEKLSSFHSACIRNDLGRVVNLLSDEDFAETLQQYSSDKSFSCVFNEVTQNGYTALHLAVKYNAEDVVNSLLRHSVDVMTQDVEGQTPFHIAFENQHLKILDSLINNLPSNAENPTDDRGLSLFHILCTRDKPEVIENILMKGIDVNASVSERSILWSAFTPMHFAVKFGQSRIVAILLKHDADISIKNALGLSPLQLFATILNVEIDLFNESVASEILSLLLGRSSREREQRNNNNWNLSPLHALCMNFDTDSEELEQYLSCHPNEINEAIEIPQYRRSHCKFSWFDNKCTPLHFAMSRPDFGQSQLLLEKGADFLKTNCFGETPLEYSVKSSLWYEYEAEEMEALFDLGACTVESFKPNLFHIACVLGMSQVVEKVIENTVNEKLRTKFFNCIDDDGRTPLHTMLINVVGESPLKRKILQMLLANGANVHAKDCELQTILHSAQRALFPDFTRIVLSYGADVNAQNLYGETPLHVCFLWHDWRHEEKIALLLENGADINIVDETGRTCIEIMKNSCESYSDYEDCILLFLEHIKKLEVIGHHINVVNKSMYHSLWDYVEDDFDEDAFVVRCENELKSMMLVNIDRYTTLRDVLFKSADRLSSYCGNVSLQSMINSDDFSKKFPIYGYLIKLQLKSGRMRRPLLEKSQMSLIDLTGRSLPTACWETVLRYLSNTDLNNIILSNKERV